VKAGTHVLALVAVLAASALCAPLARAGSYDVVSCSIDGGFYANNAWGSANNPAGNPAYQTDTSCTQQAGDSLAVSLAPNTAYGNGTYAALRLTAPPQAAITNYRLSLRHLWFAPPLPNYPTERTYTLAKLGDVIFSGAGLVAQIDQDVLSSEGHWYGYRGAHQSGAADTGVITVSRAGSTRALAAPNASSMLLAAGCFTDDGSACSLGTDGAGNVGVAVLQLFGSRVTITDSTAPALTGPTANQGLLAPGTRSGDEPLTFTASDNVGIRRAEIVDFTDPNVPRVVAAEDYASTPTAQNARCDFSRPKPCPELKAETIAASPAIAGRRTLLLRVTDTAGNQTVSAPFAITARGPLNGAGGGDGSRLVAGFPAQRVRGRGKARRRVNVLRPTKTVGFGHGASVRGILRNAAGQPVAGAELRLLVRDLKLGSHYTDRGAVTTGADGRFTFGITRGASRRVRIAYRAYPGDAALTAKSDVTLKTRASITIHAPRRVSSFGTVRFRGSLRGRPLPPSGVTLELQAYQRGRGWRTVKTTRTRKRGTYSTRYHFNSGAGRFTFRMRLRPNDSYPYSRGTSRHLRVRVA
jgi:hypothetical protein